MPLTVRDATLLGFGCLFTGAATFFYRRKQTAPFKLAYFFAWPTLGSSIILIGMPSDEKLKRELSKPDSELAARGAAARAAAAAARVARGRESEKVGE